MKVLIACEFNGRIRDAFRAKGHEAYSCDLLDDVKKNPYHIKGDVKLLLTQDWDMVIAHPPCTYLCKSGLRWLYGNDGLNQIWESRWQKMLDAVVFFNTFRVLPVPKIVIENPVLHHFAHIRIGEPTQKLQPWQFGNPECKETWLWLKGVCPLQPTKIIPKHERKKSTHRVKKGQSRSITFNELALTMAEQWG